MECVVELWFLRRAAELLQSVPLLYHIPKWANTSSAAPLKKVHDVPDHNTLQEYTRQIVCMRECVCELIWPHLQLKVNVEFEKEWQATLICMSVGNISICIHFVNC